MKSLLTKLYDLIPTVSMDQWQKVVFATLLFIVWIKLLGVRGFLFLVGGMGLLWAASTIIMYFEDKVQK